jgi:hypothetical protein
MLAHPMRIAWKQTAPIKPHGITLLDLAEGSLKSLSLGPPLATARGETDYGERTRPGAQH